MTVLLTTVFLGLSALLWGRLAVKNRQNPVWVVVCLFIVVLAVLNELNRIQQWLPGTEIYGVLVSGFALLLAIAVTLECRQQNRKIHKIDNERQRLADFSTDHRLWFWEMDKDLRFTYLSEENKAITGFDASLYLGRTRLEIAAEDSNRQKWIDHQADLENHKPIENFTYNLTTANGKLLRISINGQPVYDRDGEFLGYRGNGRDVTDEYLERQARAASEQRLQAILDNVAEAVIVTDNKTRIETFNPAAERLFGYRSEDVAGRPVIMLMIGHDRDHHDEYVERYHHTGKAKILGVRERELEAVRKNGEIFPIELNITEFKTGDDIKFIGSIRDITSRRKDAEKLRQSLLDVEKANQAKSEFLAALSHEFRTPLNSIIGFSELIMGRYLGFSDLKFYEDYIRDIHGSSKHLLTLINDVLDLSAIEAGKRALKPEPVDIRQAIEQCQSMLHGALADKNIVFQTDCDGLQSPVVADQRSIMQILVNLVSNAVKFTPSGGRISARVTENDDQHCIEVADTGEGIPPEKIAEIVKPFVMAENQGNDHPAGTGLGLAIVDQLVRLHGGRVSIESEVGAGTTVRVIFPKCERNSG